MYKILSRKIEKVDKTRALQWLELNTFESQRALRESHVSYLAKKMVRDEFRTGEIAFATFPDKTSYLMNGQHVLHAIIKSGKVVENFVELFTCDDTEDLSRLFRQYDCNPIRTINDMVKVEVDVLGLGWPYRIANLIVGAIFRLEKKTSSTNRNIKVDSLRRHLPEGHFIVGLFGGRDSGRILSKIPIVAAIIQTWKKDQEDSFDFWKGVKDGEMLKKDMPQWKLREFLIRTTFNRGSVGSYQYKNASAKEIQCRCVIAWNAYRRGKSTNLKYHLDKPIPAAI